MSAREIRDILQRELGDCGIILDVEFLPVQPFIVPESSYRELFEAGFALLRILKRAILHSGDTWDVRMTALGADESDYPLFTDDADFEDRYSDLMARPDVVIGPTGPKFLEFNVGSSFGGTTETYVFSRIWHEIYGDRAISGFWGFDSFKARTAALQAVQRELGDESGIAILGSRRDIHVVTDRFFDLEVQYLRGHGVRASFFEPEELIDGLGLPERLRYGVGLRYFNVLDWRPYGIDFASIRAAVKAGWRLVPSQSSGLLHNKKVLAWVSEGRPWMTDAERETVQRYLPWTREVKPGSVVWQGRTWDLPELLLAHPESFVLKGAIGMMGLQVLIGRTAAAEVWGKAVRDALAAEDSVVQEYVAPETAPIVMGNGSSGGDVTTLVAPVLSPCLYGSEPGGCYVRFFPDGSSGVVSVRRYGALENVLMAGV